MSSNFMVALLLSFIPWFALAQNWKLQPSGTNRPLRDVYFATSLHGWAVGDSGTILHTADGGLEWTTQPIDLSDHFYAAFFVDSVTGWIAGANGTLLYTSDGGNIWQRQQTNTSFHLRDVFFIDQSTGWAVGGNIFQGIIIGTIDGGQSWNELSDSTRGSYLGVFFLNEQEGWVVGGESLFDNFENDIILHTVNGGIHWEEQFTPTIGPLQKIFFLDRNTGWAVGHSPFAEGALRTNNGGFAWSPVPLQAGPIVTSEILRGLAVVDSQKIWISDIHAIYHSNDGGQTWVKQERESSKFLSTIFFLNLTHGWAVGQDGAIWKYQEKTISVESRDSDNDDYNLAHSSFPNPATENTQIRYSFSKDSDVVVRVYDLLGRMVATLVNEHQRAGMYTVSFDGKELPSGVYYYQISIDHRTEVRKILLVR